MNTRLRITSVAYEPDDLAAQVPFEAILLRKVGGPDRPDYWLAELVRPLAWVDNGLSRTVTHLVLAARYQGETIEPAFQQLVIGLAYVLDETLLSDSEIDFSKCRYVAIGVAESVKSDSST